MEKTGHSPCAQRRARTRTLIQLGGLVDKAGLVSFFNLEMGKDLQQEINLAPNVATLMGALLHLRHALEEDDSISLTLFEVKGKKALQK
ncbi:MAG: conjugal transfer protein TraD [Candidatus Puniceispirillum sp.]|nr:conjugal transfer protein TraD [Candidatus Puniceispirillum sp.]